MTDLFTEILQSFGIKDYDNLNSDEQDTLKGWVEKVEKSNITLEDVKNGIIAMRQVLEMEVVNVENTGRKDLMLKGRLKNMILIETILIRPERARAALDNYIAGAKVQTAK